MEMIFKNRNGKISARQQDHIETKLGKLSRYMDPITSMQVEVSAEQQAKGEVHRLQVTLVGEHGVILRADQSAPDLYTATDMVQNVLQRQIKRYKEKHWRRGKLRRKGDEFVESGMADLAADAHGVDVLEADEAETLDEEAHVRKFMRVKEFELTPMYSDEAVEQMELLDHSFFVFRDADTDRMSIVYRRRDGNYGMIVPIEI
jgi:ribosomal subunit interface protein